MNYIRVLEIISGFAIEGPLGGIERFGLELAYALGRTRFVPIVCGLWEYGTPFEHDRVVSLRKKGNEAFIAARWEEQAPYRSFRRALIGMQKAVTGRVDLIHSHCQFGDIAALLLKGPLGAQAIIRTVHNEREWIKRPLRRLFLTQMSYPWMFDAEIGVAQRVVDNLNRRPVARWLGRRAILIHNALNLQRFENLHVDRRSKRRCLGLPEEGWIVGTVGRLTEQKGYALLLEAAVLVLKRLPQTHFLVIGTGELEEDLKRLAKRLRIDTKVIFTGPRTDVEELMSMMDLFVSSSLWEGLPTVLLESMAAGVPIVATQVSGNTELIQHGDAGLLVPPGDPVSLAKAILLSLTDRQKAISMSIVARTRVQQCFSIESVAQQHVALYTTLLQEKDHPKGLLT